MSFRLISPNELSPRYDGSQSEREESELLEHGGTTASRSMYRQYDELSLAFADIYTTTILGFFPTLSQLLW